MRDWLASLQTSVLEDVWRELKALCWGKQQARNLHDLESFCEEEWDKIPHITTVTTVLAKLVMLCSGIKYLLYSMTCKGNNNFFVIFADIKTSLEEPKVWKNVYQLNRFRKNELTEG